MTDFEKNMDAIEMSEEKLEKVAGGAGNGKKLRLTKDIYARLTS